MADRNRAGGAPVSHQPFDISHPDKGGKGLRHHEVIVDFTLRGMMKLSTTAFFKLKRHVIFQKPHEYGS